MLLGYLRTIFKTYYVSNVKPVAGVLLTKPKDLEYESFIMSKYIGLMKHILAIKERRSGSTLDQDMESLQKTDLSFQQRMAIVYRSEKKKILYTIIDLCEYLKSVIDGLKKVTNMKEYHSLYMAKSEVE